MTSGMPEAHSSTASPDAGPPPVPARIVTLYVLAQFGLWTAVLTPVTISIALKVASMDGENKAASLGLILGVGALVAMVTAPVWGALSDRTTSRFGRRRPWLVGGIAAGGVGLTIMSNAPNMLVLGLGWCICQAAFNATQTALYAILPDQFPDAQRGTVSGLLGLTTVSAAVVGTLVVNIVGSATVWMFLIPLVIAAVFVGLLVVVLPDRPQAATPSDSPRTRTTALAFVRDFWISPRRHPDFAWAFLSRFLFFMGAAFVLTYQVYYLTDGLGIPAGEVAGYVALTMTVIGVVTIVASVSGGWLSDRIGRRRPVVTVAALIAAAGLLIVASSSTFTGFLIGSAVTAVGQGVYNAVDLALVAAVLPNPENAAKDMGTFQIANSLPQSLAPTIGPVILLVSGGAYMGVFIAAAIFAVLGAAAILPIRGVK